MHSAPCRVELWITDRGTCDGINLVGWSRVTDDLEVLVSHGFSVPVDVHWALEWASAEWERLFGVQLSLFAP